MKKTARFVLVMSGNTELFACIVGRQRTKIIATRSDYIDFFLLRQCINRLFVRIIAWAELICIFVAFSKGVIAGGDYVIAEPMRSMNQLDFVKRPIKEKHLFHFSTPVSVTGYQTSLQV